MSQLELGQALGYAATMISAFETGRRRLKVEDLTRACIVLDKEPEYFLRVEKLRPAAIGMTLRAQLASVPNDELAAAIECFLDELEDDLAPASAVPDLRDLQPTAAARTVLHFAGITEPPVETEEVCQALGVPLRRRRFPDALSALVIELADGAFVIGVNETHFPTRQQFSTAHELGHAVLRHPASYYLEYSVDDAGDPPGYSYLDERAANQFAASLLMDERWVRRDFADGVRRVGDLAELYRVSPEAMGFRLIDLGLR